MARFNLKKQARNEKRKAKSFEEFSRSKNLECEATITVAGRRIKGIIFKESPEGFVFIEQIPLSASLLAGNQRKPVRLNVTLDGKVWLSDGITLVDDIVKCTQVTEQESNNE